MLWGFRRCMGCMRGELRVKEREVGRARGEKLT